MQFASLSDQPVRDFTEEARKISGLLEGLFGRSVYCHAVNWVSNPENSIYSLRPAKQTEIARLAMRGLTAEERKAADRLAQIIRSAFPLKITDFRFVRDPEDSSLVYLENEMGEKSDSRPENHFVARSRVTLWKKCWNLGNFNYHGTSEMIEPFKKFCLLGQTANRMVSPLALP